MPRTHFVSLLSRRYRSKPRTSAASTARIAHLRNARALTFDQCSTRKHDQKTPGTPEVTQCSFGAAQCALLQLNGNNRLCTRPLCGRLQAAKEPHARRSSSSTCLCHPSRSSCEVRASRTRPPTKAICCAETLLRKGVPGSLKHANCCHACYRFGYPSHTLSYS